MKDIEQWQPSKFVFVDGRLEGSRDPNEVGVGSRIMANGMATMYQRALECHAHGSLLDLGCGKVPLFGAYRRRVVETVCVDWPGSLHGSRHIDLFRDLNEGLDIPSNSHDTILLSDVLEHIRRPGKLLDDVSRCLRTNGILIMGVPFLYWLHEEPHDYHRYTRHALTSMVEDSGLSVSSIEETGGAPEVIADIVGKVAAKWPRAQGMIVATMQRALRLPQVRRLSESTKSQFPLGYVVVARKDPAAV